MWGLVACNKPILLLRVHFRLKVVVGSITDLFFLFHAYKIGVQKYVGLVLRF